MRFDGKLEKWNDDRGFGFVTPARGGEPVFVHVSAFPRDGRRPQLGEALSFEVEPAGDGKKQAVRVQRPGSAARSRPLPPAADPDRRSRAPRSRRGGSPLFGAAAALLLAAGGGGYLYSQFSQRMRPLAEGSTPAEAPSAASRFQCDGRTHCSQMTSCEEATFFLQNCPGTQMDGNRDGIPCERQWCTGPLGR